MSVLNNSFSNYDIDNLNEFFSYPTSSEFFTISHLNIRSFNANSENYFGYLHDYIDKIDVHVFSETWFSSSNFHSINSYNSFHTVRKNRARGGGVSVYVQNKHKSQKLGNLSKIFNTFEVLTVLVTIGGSFSFYIVAVYRPPEQRHSSVEQFFYEFNAFLEIEFNPLDRLVVVGDVNIDISPNSNFGLEFTSLMESHAFSSLINDYTREPENARPSIIDHIWTNMEFSFNSGIFKSNISDHHIICTSLNVPNSSDPIFKSFRDHSTAAITRFGQEFVNFSLEYSEMCLTASLNEKVEHLKNGILEIYNKCCPIRTKVFRGDAVFKPWITDHIKSMIKFKHFLYSQSKKRFIPQYVYKKFANNLDHKVKKAKSDYVTNTFRNSIGNAQKTWKNIHSLLLSSNRTSGDIVLSSGDSLLTSDSDVANRFNQHFVEAAVQLDANMPPPSISFSTYLGHPVFNPFFVQLCTPDEVRKLILSFPNKSCNINEIPVTIYKEVSDILSVIIAELFNQSIDEGIFPSSLKSARLVPIFKKGDSTLVNNYRPISILHFFSKLFEKLMYVRLLKFIDNNSSISRRQFGFRAGLSTSDAIIEFLNHVYDRIDKKNKLIAVFLDFSKAFETVNHILLLNKLHHYGIRGCAHRWFSSYLSSRSQYVQCGKSKSNEAMVQLGVPQGSTLGPLLFIIYINDLYMCTSLDLVHYADDTTVFASHPDIHELVRMITVELEKIKTWLQSNRLSLNISKTFYTVFGSNSTPIPSLYIGAEPLECVCEVKFLGITIDTSLTFKGHINEIISKIDKTIGILYKYKRHVPQSVLKSIYFSLIWSQMVYGVVAWGRRTVGGTNKVIRAQNKVMKIIFGSHSAQTYIDNRILQFDRAFEFFSLLKLHNELYSSDGSYFSEIIRDIQSDHSYPTRFRSDLNLVPPRYSTARSSKSFIKQSIDMWNELPGRLKIIHDAGKFKFELKKYLLDATH